MTSARIQYGDLAELIIDEGAIRAARQRPQVGPSIVENFGHGFCREIVGKNTNAAVAGGEEIDSLADIHG
ncbi:MAG TPA: hypothetical protein VF944_08955, partial [Candidatus Bathyarchaeia archaeon]